MKLVLVVLVAVPVAFVLGGVFLYQSFGAMGLGVLVLLMLGAMVGLKKLAGWGLTRLMLGAFEAKGKVLRGAAAEIHRIRPAPAPVRREEEDESDEDETPSDWYFIDVTIRPEVQDGSGFTLWEPGELRLVSPDYRGTVSADEDTDETTIGTVHSYLVWDGASFVEDELGKLEGTQRIELHVGVLPGTSKAALCYYFSPFGSLNLPSPQTPSARAEELRPH